MPIFEYVAMDNTGKKTKGFQDAESLAAVRKAIKSQGKYLVEIKETQGKKKAKNRQVFTQINSRISRQELYVTTRQLATLLGAGIPLVQALNGLVQQTNNRHFKQIIVQIKDAVNEGYSLTEALRKHPKLFSRVYINMVQAGEASGSLDVVLERLAEFGEKQIALYSRIRAALLYPILMTIVGSGILFFLLSYVVPKVTAVFTGSQHKLPFVTQILIDTSTFCQQYWWFLLLCLIAIIGACNFLVKSPLGRKFVDRQKLTLPGLKDLNIKIAAARFGRTMASLITAGVSLSSSLAIVKHILNNSLLAEALDEARSEMEKGHSLSQFLQKRNIFPPMLVQMVAVGEQSGTLGKMFEKVADNYEKEVEAKVLGLTSLIEPLLILVMGAAVCFIVIAILLPIFEMNQLIK